MSAVAEQLAAEKELAEQPRERRKLIEDFVARLTQQAIEQSRERESLEELKNWAELSDAFASLVTHASGDVLARLLDALEAAQGEVSDAEALEDWGRLRVLGLYEEARAGVHTVAWLEEHGISRQRLNQWRVAKRLVGIRGLPGVRGFAYPRWQFADNLQPREFMRSIVAASEEARMDPLGLHFFMTEPVPGYGKTPVDLLDAGEEELAVGLVRAGNAQGT